MKFVVSKPSRGVDGMYAGEPSSVGCTPYDGLYREAPCERGVFFSHQVYERVGISLVDVY